MPSAVCPLCYGLRADPAAIGKRCDFCDAELAAESRYESLETFFNARPLEILVRHLREQRAKINSAKTAGRPLARLKDFRRNIKRVIRLAKRSTDSRRVGPQGSMLRSRPRPE